MKPSSGHSRNCNICYTSVCFKVGIREVRGLDLRVEVVLSILFIGLRVLHCKPSMSSLPHFKKKNFLMEI